MVKRQRHGATYSRKSRQALTLLGGLSPAEFLAEYWQKKPLLVRGAIANFNNLLTPQELAGIALEPTASSRLVLEKGGRRPWQLEHGPFTPQRLQALPKSHWSLLVSNLEQWLEPAALLLDQFSFVPHWRADDLMVSFAPPGGSVGAHVDSYDVFLLQGLGSRRWAIAEGGNRRLISGIDLRILRHFKAESEWELQPGDMLYLPPGVAHHGVATSDCMTYSIGFRAPAQRDLLADFYNLPANLLDGIASDRLYSDPGLEWQENPGAVTAAALQRVASMLQGPLADQQILGRWFGAFITRPSPRSGIFAGRGASPGEATAKRRRLPSVARLQSILGSMRTVWRSDSSRFAYFAADGASEIYFYVDGDELALPRAVLPLVKAICARRCYHGLELAVELPKGRSQAREVALLMLRQMLAHGSLYLGS